MSDRTETIKPVRIDLGDGDSLNLYRMSDYVTVVRFHGNNPNVQLSSAQVSTTALRAALDEVAPAGSYTRTDEPRPLTPDAMTAREHLDAAWEAAHVPERDHLPDRAVYISRHESGNYRIERAYHPTPASEQGYERRLLDPPTPARPEGAEELARLIADADVGEWDCGDLADALIATGRVRVVGEDDGGDETPDVCPHVGGPGGDCGCPL